METVLIFRLGSLGDTVVALPCFHKIAQTFPDARRIVLTNVPVASNAAPLLQILDGSGLVHGALTYPISLRDPKALRGLAQSIRATGAQTLVHMTARRGFIPALRDAAFFRMAGIQRIVGAPLRSSVREPLVDAAANTEEPEAGRITRQLADLGPVDLNDRANWDLRLQPMEIAHAHDAIVPLLGAPFFAIHAAAKLADKCWNDDRWPRLLERLTRRYPEFGLALIGAADERAACDALARVWSGSTVNLCGKLTPRQSAAVLERSILFIGHDSGPMHLAASRGTRCVAIFGKNNRPKRWYPYGEGHTVFHDMRGVDLIEPDAVFAGIEKAMTARN